MMALNIQQYPFSLPILIILSSVLMNFFPCLAKGFSSALATWYGPPNGAGSGGACGFANDVAQPPYSSMISAGNANIFRSGQGCGECYEVKCSAPACSGNPITVTITDECPGACNNVPFHFDLSGHAFGAMAHPGQEHNLRQLGQVDIVYRRVQCNYPGANIAFKVDPKINPYYFASAIEFENGDGDLGSVELQTADNQWISMQQSWGATWSANISPSTKTPFSFKVTTLTSEKSLVATNVIPTNYQAGATYRSRVNF